MIRNRVSFPRWPAFFVHHPRHRTFWSALGIVSLISLSSGCSDDAGTETDGTGDPDTQLTSATGGMTTTATGTTVGLTTSGNATGDATGSTTLDPGTSTGDDPQALTFWDDIAPIYYDKCVSCHVAGGAAPFALDNFADAKQWAVPSANATAARTMPPWLATSDGSCGEFTHDRSLSDEQIEIIGRWAAEGAMHEGTPRDLSVTPQVQLPDPRIVHSPEYVPQPLGTDTAKWDDYRCLVIDPEFTEPTFLTGYGIIPGNDALVHHVILFAVDTTAKADEGGTNAERMAALDAESPDRLGWPCYSAAGEGVAIDGVPGVWAPGQGDVIYPDNSGLPMTPNHVFVAQFHYNFPSPDLVGQSDRTAVELQTSPVVERLGSIMLDDGIIGSDVALPPGQSELTIKWDHPYEWTMFAQMGVPEVNLWGIMPHMHGYGTRQTLELVNSGSDDGQCLTHVERWDFDWQNFYMFTEPVRFGAGQALRSTCQYDTTSATNPVLPGWGTDNEMCTTIYYATMEFPPGWTH